MRNVIGKSENLNLLKIETLKGKIKQLEQENENFKNEVEILERKSTQNGILVFGLKQND